MISNTNQPLVGERCPAADIAKCLGNRNIFEVLADASGPSRAGSGRTVHEQASTVGTPETHETKFEFVECSPGKWEVYECPKCEGWGWIATDGDRSKPRDCDNCEGGGLVAAPPPPSSTGAGEK